MITMFNNKYKSLHTINKFDIIRPAVFKGIHDIKTSHDL